MDASMKWKLCGPPIGRVTSLVLSVHLSCRFSAVHDPWPRNPSTVPSVVRGYIISGSRVHVSVMSLSTLLQDVLRLERNQTNRHFQKYPLTRKMS